MISFLLLNGVIFIIISIVMVKKDLYLKCNMKIKDLQNQEASLSLTLTTLTPLPTKEEILPHKTYLISRTRCTQKIFLLIMVFTSPAYFDRRSVIRQTWATDPSMETRWKTVFLLGQTPDDSVQNEYLEAEGVMHRDLIRGAQKENYYNLTLKTQMGLEWASKYCDFQYLLKTDDDVFVNPYLLMDYLRKPDTPKTKLYTGRCPDNARPFREGKYGVSFEEYNRTTYPAYCRGTYLLSSDVVHKLVEMFDVSKKNFKMEDVYIGLLVERMGGVKARQHPFFRFPEECKLSPDTFSHHSASVECMGELFNMAMKERVEHELAQLRSSRMTNNGTNNTEH